MIPKMIEITKVNILPYIAKSKAPTVTMERDSESAGMLILLE